MIYKKSEEIRSNRTPEYSVNDIIISRWSPRAMSGEPIDDKELFSLFEAAKWAPSASNIQPWRFIYSKKGSENWDKFFNLLVEFNKLWAKNASVLIVIIPKKTNNEGSLSKTHSFDAGAAWQNLALEASSRGLIAHGMAGFDYEKAAEVLEIPSDYKVEAMIAVGKRGPLENIPERMRKSELPSKRKSVHEIIMEGRFRGEIE